MADKDNDKAAGSKPPANKSNEAQGKAAAKQPSKAASKGKQQKSDSKSKQAKSAPKKPNVFQRLFTYLKNVRLEVKRTSWPGRSEVGRMSLIVIGALLFFGITIFGIDTVMTWVVGQYSLLFAGADQVPLGAAPLAEMLSTINEALSSLQ